MLEHKNRYKVSNVNFFMKIIEDNKLANLYANNKRGSN